MAKRTQQVCQHLVEHHGGRAEDLWDGAADAKDLFKRLNALPGYGKEKAKIFMALLAKRFGITPDGWEEVAAPFSDAERRSIADVELARHAARGARVEEGEEGGGQGQGRVSREVGRAHHR